MILPHRKHIRGEGLPWIVFVNGLFTDQDSWSSAIEAIKEFNILTYDGRGQGNAPKLESSYELDQQVLDLEALIDHTSLDKFALIGLSNGGRVALKFASLHSEKIWSLIACDTYANITPLIKLKIESWLKAHHLGGALHRFDIAAPWVWGEGLLESRPELVSFYREKSVLADEKNIISLIEGSLSGEVSLENISCPTLLVAGEEDLLTPPFHHKKLVEKIKNSKYVAVPGGHASLIEHPESFDKVILPHLRSLHELG